MSIETMFIIKVAVIISTLLLAAFAIWVANSITQNDSCDESEHNIHRDIDKHFGKNCDNHRPLPGLH